MKYREEENFTKNQRQEYLDGIERIIRQRERDAEKMREEFIKDVFTDGSRYREEFKSMLGWPLVGYKNDKLPTFKSQKLSDEDGYSIYRMQFEILEGLTMTGLYFKGEGENRPLVIIQHGRLGTPEIISGIYGNTYNYNDMLQRVISRGVDAFAPQLLLWDEQYEIPFNRSIIDSKLKRVGSSITAVEIYGITKIIDHFEKVGYKKFGMVGLSYGGFYTLFTSAIDTRIKASISCSFFNTRDFAYTTDWNWLRSSEKFDDAEIACLTYPRKIWIEMGDKDELFDYKVSIKSFEKIKKYCKDVGTDWVEFLVFDGVHEFYKGDDHIEKFIKEVLKD